MKTETTKIVMRFADSSQWPGQFVALDRASGGYPRAVEDPTLAEFWESEEKALDFASSFAPYGPYKDHAIDPKVYVLRATVEEPPTKKWCNGTAFDGRAHPQCPDPFDHGRHQFEVPA